MINWDRVNELRSDFGEEDFVEIATMFIAEVEEKLSEMRQGDAQDLSEGYHFLKGGAANLGFLDMQKVCGNAEAHGRRDVLPEVQAVFAASKESFLSETR